MNARTIGHRLFTDGVTQPVYEDERGQFIEEGSERIGEVWLVPEEDQFGDGADDRTRQGTTDYFRKRHSTSENFIPASAFSNPEIAPENCRA
jgi:hypothetical protein